MRYGGRIAAAIEVLEDVLGRYTPANDALRDWGKSHRFAGSKDRSAIGGLVHDSLRTKSSTAWRMDDESARALVLGTLVFHWGESIETLDDTFKEDDHAPSPITDKERKALSASLDLKMADDWVQADIPEWVWDAFQNNYGEEAVAEGRALTARPPLDMRVNTLKSDAETALAALKAFGAALSPLSPMGLRVKPGTKLDRLPNIQAEPIYLTGGIDIQDEGSQLVSVLVDAQPDDLVLDYCAGGGGKSLAMAAEMGKSGSGAVYAYDIDKRRLAPIYDRAMRAGADKIEVRQPPVKSLNDLTGKMDRVLIDAPCSGSGTWRRKPDAKWRLSPETLDVRMNEQAAVLKQAKAYVKPGGLLFYVTCSVFAEENEGQVYPFLDENPDFELLSAGETWEEKIGDDKPKPWSEDGCTITMTPASTNTDGFFFAVMQRKLPSNFNPETE